jgi:hypothetical protein
VSRAAGNNPENWRFVYEKFVLIIILVLLALPAFSQEKDGFAQTDDPYAKFHGVWLGRADGGDLWHFIFSNNSLTIIGKDIGLDIIYFRNYFIDKNTVVYIIKCMFGENDDDVWLMAPEEIDKELKEEITKSFQYIFSGNKLVLIEDGYPISLQRPKVVNH